jgi:DNA-binding NtrC family response regulator
MPVTPRVLAVAKEPSEFAGFAASLKDAGIEVNCANGFLDGILHQVHSAASVIICDADFMHWRTALEAFNSVDGKPPVIFLSRGADDSLWLEMLSGGAFDLLPKNCGPGELRRVVRAALKQRNARKEVLAICPGQMTAGCAAHHKEAP